MECFYEVVIKKDDFIYDTKRFSSYSEAFQFAFAEMAEELVLHECANFMITIQTHDSDFCSIVVDPAEFPF